MVRGSAWVLADTDPPLQIRAGDCVLLRGPDHYTVADDPATEPRVFIGPGQTCSSADGVDLSEQMRLGVRTWGNSPDGPTLLLTGTYTGEGEVSLALLRGLPPMVSVERSQLETPLIALLAAEAVKDAPGQEAVLDRILDLLLVALLRAWFSRPEAQAPAWYRASGDPVVGTALKLIHHNPAHPWTVAGLAREVGLSRAALARRFQELVGEPPISYLTGWRIALAADLLVEPGQTIGSVAAQLGYSTPYALSTAFKRVRGISPREYREAVRTAAEPPPPPRGGEYLRTADARSRAPIGPQVFS